MVLGLGPPLCMGPRKIVNAIIIFQNIAFDCLWTYKVSIFSYLLLYGVWNVFGHIVGNWNLLFDSNSLDMFVMSMVRPMSLWITSFRSMIIAIRVVHSTLLHLLRFILSGLGGIFFFYHFLWGSTLAAD